MKFIIDTSQKDLYVALVEGNKTIAYLHKKDIVKKSDMLPVAFKKFLIQMNLKTKDINEFYVTLGPGSFMGARTALVFARTICQVTGAKLFTTDTLTFISGGTPGEYFLDARSNTSYRGIVSETEPTTLDLVEFQPDSILNYKQLISNPGSFLKNFKLEDNLEEVKPLYVKSPKIGGGKKWKF